MGSHEELLAKGQASPSLMHVARPFRADRSALSHVYTKSGNFFFIYAFFPVYLVICDRQHDQEVSKAYVLMLRRRLAQRFM